MMSEEMQLQGKLKKGTKRSFEFEDEINEVSSNTIEHNPINSLQSSII